MREDEALVSLLTRAGIASTPYWRNLWFPNCRLVKNWLLCLDAPTAQTIARLFLPQLRSVMSDIEIRTDNGTNFTAQYPRKEASSIVKEAALRKAQAKQVYTGQAVVTERNADLLDE